MDKWRVTPEEGKRIAKIMAVQEFDLSKITDVEVEDAHGNQYPEFEDAYISAAYYNGIEMTEEQLDRLNEDEGEFVHDKALESFI